MAQQFYTFKPGIHGAHNVQKFEKPVRKITLLYNGANDACGISIAYDISDDLETFKYGENHLFIPGNNTPVKLDFQSKNCGFGVEGIVAITSADKPGLIYVSVDEYADSSAGNSKYFIEVAMR